MVHLLPHWNFRGKEGEKIKVFAYTNCEELELYLNGESVGKQKIEKYGHGEWYVNYEPGEIKVIAKNNGKVVCEDERRTTGKAERLMLKLENKNITANGRDVAIITCYCVDENGFEVPDARPYVSFNTNNLGKIIGTGSDITDHTLVNLPDRKMRAGRITIAVQVAKISGKLKIYAESENLVSGKLEIEI